MEVLEILGKNDQSGHLQPIRMSKTTGFPGRNAISSKRGGGRGGSKMQNPREKRGSKWSKAVYFEPHFWSKSREFGRVWFILIEFVPKAVQNDHIQATKSGSTTLKRLLGLADADTHPLADEKTSGSAIEDDDALDRADVVHFTRIEDDRTLCGPPSCRRAAPCRSRWGNRRGRRRERWPSCWDERDRGTPVPVRPERRAGCRAGR